MDRCARSLRGQGGSGAHAFQQLLWHSRRHERPARPTIAHANDNAAGSRAAAGMDGARRRTAAVVLGGVEITLRFAPGLGDSFVNERQGPIIDVHNRDLSPLKH